MKENHLTEHARPTVPLHWLIDWFSWYFGVFPVWQRGGIEAYYESCDVTRLTYAICTWSIEWCATTQYAPTFIAICWSVKCIKSRERRRDHSFIPVPPPRFYIFRNSHDPIPPEQLPSSTDLPKLKKCQEAGYEQQEIIINERRNEKVKVSFQAWLFVRLKIVIHYEIQSVLENNMNRNPAHLLVQIPWSQLLVQADGVDGPQEMEIN